MLTGDDAPRPDSRRRLTSWLGGVVVAGVGVAILLRNDTPPAAIAIFSIALAWGAVLPGVIVHRALRGRMSSWLEDLSLGAATGIALGLGAWALASLANVRGLLWLWPVVVLPLAWLPHTRDRVRSRPGPEGWSTSSAVAMVIAALAAMWHMERVFVSSVPAPPSAALYYQDLLWHLGLASEAKRALPLGTPQVVGDGALQYHWFSNAYNAAMSLMSGLDVVVVMTRLWILPFAVLMVTLTAVLTYRLSGRAWAGAGAALVCQAMLPYHVYPGVVDAYNHFSGNSPSQYFAYPMMLLTVHALVDIVRRGWSTGRGTYAVAVLGMLACSGAKASALPVILGGVALSLLAVLFLRRNPVPILLTAVAVAAVTVLGLKLVSGGDAGSGYQLLSILTRYEAYRALVTRRPDLHTGIAQGLFVAKGVGAYLGIGLLIATFIAFARSLVFVLPILQRRLRVDPAAWLLAGICASALVPLFVISHSGYSQLYFMYGTIPFGSALAMWGVADVLDDDRRRQLIAAAAGALAGGASVAVAYAQRHTDVTDNADLISALKSLVLTATAVVTVIVGVLTVGWLVSRRRPDVIRPIVVGVLLGPVAVATFYESATATDYPDAFAKAPVVESRLHQSQAAEWVKNHVPDSAVVATNQHCQLGHGIRCSDARMWWLSGLSGRRVLLEGWGYSPKAVLNKGFYDPALYELNQTVFTNPSTDNVAAIKARGVRWLVGVRGDTPELLVVADALAEFADKRYDNGTVAIFELR